MNTQEMISATIKSLDEQDRKLRKSRVKVAEHHSKLTQCRSVQEFERVMVLEAKWRKKERTAEMNIEVLAKTLIDLTKLG